MFKSNADNSVNNDNQDLPTKTGPINSSNGLMKRMALNDTKAGMEGLDVRKINHIIEEASKGSKFYIHQQNQQDKLNVRIQHIQESFRNLTEEQIRNSTAMVIWKYVL